MKKKLLWAGVILSVMVAGCAEKPLPMRKTYLYCQVDTLWQSLPSYQVTSNRLFPYSKLAPFGDYAEAAYSDGIALIELEINKPTTVSVMPVWDPRSRWPGAAISCCCRAIRWNCKGWPTRGSRDSAASVPAWRRSDAG